MNSELLHFADLYIKIYVSVKRAFEEKHEMLLSLKGQDYSKEKIQSSPASQDKLVLECVYLDDCIRKVFRVIENSLEKIPAEYREQVLFLFSKNSLNINWQEIQLIGAYKYQLKKDIIDSLFGEDIIRLHSQGAKEDCSRIREDKL